MSGDYEPGITELRVNVKACITQIQALTDSLGETRDLLKREQDNAAEMTKELVDIKSTLNTMRAKLYENGIR